jgi:hypothetical protein
MKVRVTTTAQAREQARRACDWWSRNRSSAPKLLSEEVARGLELLVGAPDIGRFYEYPDIPGLRRLLLRRTRYLSTTSTTERAERS